MNSLGVVDYGVGNLQSVCNALNKVGVRWGLISEARDIAAHNRLLLPGVGAFGSAVSRMDEAGLTNDVKSAAFGGIPLLGICLGMQLLSEGSEESGGVAGLSLIAGSTRAIFADSASTNTGFRRVSLSEATDGLGDSRFRDYYLNHGYHVVPDASSAIAGSCEWRGTTVVSALSSGTVHGVQFHPEKSQGQGLSLLYHFAVTGRLAL